MSGTEETCAAVEPQHHRCVLRVRGRPYIQIQTILVVGAGYAAAVRLAIGVHGLRARQRKLSSVPLTRPRRWFHRRSPTQGSHWWRSERHALEHVHAVFGGADENTRID